MATRTKTESVRDKVFATIGARRFREVTVPGLGSVRLRSLMESERQELEKANTKDPDSARARMVAAAIVDEEGKRVFGESDVEQLQQIDASITLAMFQAIAEHWSGATIEDTIKNSSTTLDGDSLAS